MVISVFSCLGFTVSAVDAADLFTVEGSLKNDRLTYTVYLNKGVNLMGSVVYAKFDDKVLSVDTANCGAYMIDDGEGDERENIIGEYVNDFMNGTTNCYSVAHVYGLNTDYKAGSTNKPYIVFSFKVKDSSRPKTKVEFYCYEFNSHSIPENNIANGTNALICSDSRVTLGETRLVGFNNTDSGIEIQWEKTVGADYYRVFKIVDGKYVGIHDTENASVTSYEDTDVKNGESYTYTVRAINKYGYNSSYDKSGITAKRVVSPEKIVVTNGDGKVTVKWSKVSGADSYKLFKRIVNSDGTVGSWESASKKTTALSADDTAVKSGYTYEYSVRAYSGDSYSTRNVKTENMYLSAPSFTVSAGVNGVDISWNKVNGAEGYKIYRKIGNGSYKKIKTVITGLTYTDAAVNSGQKAYYRVLAVKDSYTSTYATKSLTFLQTPAVTLQNTASGVKASWGKVSGAKIYYVYRKAGSESSWKKIAETKNTSYTDKSVKSGTKYKYCVRAVNGSVKSNYSGVKIVFLSAPKLSAISAQKGSITVSWKKVSGASGYTIYRKAGSGGYKKYAVVSSGSTLKFKDKSVSKGTTYSYRVCANNGSYIGTYNSQLSAKAK